MATGATHGHRPRQRTQAATGLGDACVCLLVVIELHRIIGSFANWFHRTIEVSDLPRHTHPIIYRRTPLRPCY